MENLRKSMTNTERILEALSQLDLARQALLRPELTIEAIRQAKESSAKAHSHLLQCEQNLVGVPEPVKGD